MFLLTLRHKQIKIRTQLRNSNILHTAMWHHVLSSHEQRVHSWESGAFYKRTNDVFKRQFRGSQQIGLGSTRKFLMTLNSNQKVINIPLSISCRKYNTFACEEVVAVTPVSKLVTRIMWPLNVTQTNTGVTQPATFNAQAKLFLIRMKKK